MNRRRHSRPGIASAVLLASFILSLCASACNRSESTPPRGSINNTRPIPAQTDQPKQELNVAVASPVNVETNVLVVSPAANREIADGIIGLLQQHGITTHSTDEETVTVQQGSQYDLVIVAGEGRYTSFSLEFDVPVLGYGCHGCSYFGRLRLKHGQPYT